MRLALLLLAAAPLTLSAQQKTGGPPPRPPVRPVEPARPVPAPAPRAVPAPRPLVIDEWGQRLDLNESMIWERAYDLENRSFEMRVNQELLSERLHEMTAPMVAEWSEMAPLAAQLDYERVWGPAGGLGRLGSPSPRAPWAQDDPADSLYRVAREALNRGEYRRAAGTFGEIPTRFSKSRYAADALYWRAFSLYRIGGADDLRSATAALEQQTSQYPQARTQNDAVALATRIMGALAARGDAAAAQALRAQSASNPGSTCDREDQSVRGEALSAIVRADATQALPTLRSVLQRRDECSEPLRVRAVSLLGDFNNGEQSTLMADVVRNDPSANVRANAMEWLVRMQGEQNIAIVEGLLRQSNDAQVQSSALRALASSDAPRARTAVRSVIENNDAPYTLRRDAISRFPSGTRATSDDAAYLRGVYARITEPRLKSAIASSIARTDSEENRLWLMALARNTSEPMDARASALSMMSRSETPVTTIIQLYDTMSERPMRERLVSALGRRDEPAATDKLLDIARTGTDPTLRRMAIGALTRKDDPRTTRLLLEIINK